MGAVLEAETGRKNQEEGAAKRTSSKGLEEIDAHQSGTAVHAERSGIPAATRRRAACTHLVTVRRARGL